MSIESTPIRTSRGEGWIRSLLVGLVLGAGSVAWGQSLGDSRTSVLPEPRPIFDRGTTGSGQAPTLTPLNGLDGALKSQEEAGGRFRETEELRLRAEIRALKEKEKGKGPVRFASDLFDQRQASFLSTDGAVSEDYTLGVGDRLQLNVYGSATFEAPVTVDGRGMLNLPKLGSVKASGLTLARAKQAVQALVSRNFSRSTAELQVVKLREIRVSILGEVYVPGSYLVPSLGSLVNVLGLAGGPTRTGSLRDIRVLRGGEVVFRLDLYPLRAEGKGNPNFALQSGDVIFVPLANLEVVLEGAFLRVAAGQSPLGNRPDPSAQRPALSPQDLEKAAQVGRTSAGGSRSGAGKAKSATSKEDKGAASGEGPEESEGTDGGGPTDWFTSDQAQPPSMIFEVLPGESLERLVGWAGGPLPGWSSGTLSLRRISKGGGVEVHSFKTGELGGAAFPLQRGDVLSAFPQREFDASMVTLQGWVRVPGTFEMVPGLRVGELLKRDQQLLPDTYRLRGEVVRTHEDGRTSYLSFSVEEALKGNPQHDLLLENRDKIKLFRLDDLRLKERVTILGPVPKAGEIKFHRGMRASDLLFLGGTPDQSANRLVAELARAGKGGPSKVIRLDLVRLLSDESRSSVGITDDAVNPLLEPDDQISLYEIPDFRVHQVVKISGQVKLPGSYALDRDGLTLMDLIKRAGGLTGQAMPKAGIFLRPLNASREKATTDPNLDVDGPNLSSKGINDILERLSEVKRHSTTGQLVKHPLMHGLSEGKLNRMVVNFDAILKGDRDADVVLQDGDEIIIPSLLDTAYVVGEASSPFGTYKVRPGMKVKDLLALAGGTTRNADTWHICLLKADGRILDSWVNARTVEPGDAVLVPQKFRRDTSWQENLNALTPIALILNAVLR